MKDKFDAELEKLGGGYLPPQLETKFLYRIVVHCDPPIEVGNVYGTVKRVIPITGGTFEGPEMRGSVLPLGADWNSSAAEDQGRRKVDTRYMLQTDDGAMISLSTIGFSRRSSDVMAARAAGERIDPASYYFRQHLFFETESEKYEWLNYVVAFGIVMSKFQGGPGVIYDAYYLK